MATALKLKQYRTVAVISPHLDDAVLSCFDHIRELISIGAAITVINCFSRYRNDNIISPLIAPFMQAVDCHNPTDYEKIRKAEDSRALGALNITTINLDFIDAGFRGSFGMPDYMSIADLCHHNSSKDKKNLVEALIDILQKYQRLDSVLIPMAVGNHIDHVLSRAAAERCWGVDQRIYYADIPYALRPWKWRCKDISLALPSRPSIKWTSPQKLQAVRCYESQLPFVLPRTTRFPEILFYGR